MNDSMKRPLMCLLAKMELISSMQHVFMKAFAGFIISFIEMVNVPK